MSEDTVKNHLHRILERCNEHFRKNAGRLIKASLGAACEQWINTELFTTLNFDQPFIFPKGIWVRPEHLKIDLAIVEGQHEPYKIHAYIENKVVYPNNLHQSPIIVLMSQLNRHLDGELLSVPRIGMVFTCWNSYWKTSHSSFISNVDKIIASHAANFNIAKPNWISLTNKIEFQWQDDNIDVEIGVFQLTLVPEITFS